jgi:hypothetical protein
LGRSHSSRPYVFNSGSTGVGEGRLTVAISVAIYMLTATCGTVPGVAPIEPRTALRDSELAGQFGGMIIGLGLIEIAVRHVCFSSVVREEPTLAAGLPVVVAGSALLPTRPHAP